MTNALGAATPRMDKPSPVPAPGASLPKLQQQRDDLVKQYVEARPTGSDRWQMGAGIAGGVLGAAAGIGVIALANAGRGPLYQGLNMIFMAPAAAIIGGGSLGFIGSRVADVATRPKGEAATAQVTEHRQELAGQITAIDARLQELDGRTPRPLPTIDDSTEPSLTRLGGHTAAGFGLGVLATGGMIGGFEALKGVKVGDSFGTVAPLFGATAAVAAISYLNQRDEAAGRQGSMLRSAAIGAGAVGAGTLAPGFGGIPIPIRLAAGAVAGAAIGTFMHTVSVSSRD